jgi:hypothetical protein
LDNALRKKDVAKIAQFNDELKLPEFPKELGYLWRVYQRIRRRMSSGFAGPNPIGWIDIDAFVRQTKFPLAPWEIELLEAIDDAYLEPQAQALREKIGKTKIETVDASDTKAVRGLMRGLADRRRQRKRDEVH